eukprot:2606175-Alexandrium_andersonii.AAC.1
MPGNQVQKPTGPIGARVLAPPRSGCTPPLRFQCRAPPPKKNPARRWHRCENRTPACFRPRLDQTAPRKQRSGSISGPKVRTCLLYTSPSPRD